MNYYQRIQQSIDFIEENLKRKFSLEDVARAAYCSLYHFHRIFSAMVGSSVKEYIRKRRLTQAARELIETKKTIIQIALEYQYEAPEGFTRAFKALYKQSPSLFRKNKHFGPVYNKINLLELERIQKKGGIKMQPKIVVRESFKVAGYEIITDHEKCKKDVPSLWDEKRKEMFEEKIISASVPGVVYGICYGICASCCSGVPEGDESFSYLICSDVNDFEGLPESYTAKTIPAAKYAVFTVAGREEEMKKVSDYIYGTWLPNTNYELADSPELERYDSRWFSKDKPEMELWIPVK